NLCSSSFFSIPSQYLMYLSYGKVFSNLVEISSSLRTGLMGLTPRIPKATDSSLTSVLSVGILSNLLSDSFLCQSAVFRHNIVSYIVSFILSRSYACGSRSHKRIKDNVSDI